MPKSWYSKWFDSPYYHLLYSQRDDAEAKAFIMNLAKYLNLPEGAYILDLACGRGRHAIGLANLGFDVTGIDLSTHSIRIAREYEHDKLNFFVHDIRHPFRVNYFHAVLNLFTSFGYFQTDKEDSKVIANAHRNLQKEGYFVLDYLNSSYVEKHLVASNTVYRDGVKFEMERNFDGKMFNKKISITDDQEEIEFNEHVRAYQCIELQSLLEMSGFKIVETFGDYQLGPFHELESKRAIIISIKENA